MELIFFHKTKNTDSNDNSNQLWREKNEETNIKRQPLSYLNFFVGTNHL